MKTPSVVAALIPALAIALLLGACSSREERKVEYFNRAQAAFNAGDFAKASVDTKNALQIDETYVDARFLWAQLYEKQQNWQQMIGNLRIVLEYDKNHLEARLKYGTILMAAQLLEDAMAEADAAIAIKPDSAEALALKGAVFYKQGLNAQAIATAQQALAAEPANNSAVAVLAEAYKADQPELALQIIQDAIDLRGNNEAFKLLQISLYESTAQTDEAVATYEALIAENPENLYYYYRYVTLLQQENRPEAAEAQIRKIADALPEVVELKIWLIQYLVTNRDLATAESTLQRYIEQYPEQTELQIGMGQLLSTQNKVADAKSYYQRLIEDSDKTELAQRSRIALATLEVSSNNRQKAREIVNEVLAVEPENPQALLFTAEEALDEGKLDEAIANARAVLRNRPDSTEALELLAKAHVQSNSIELALDNYKQVLLIEPSNQTALTQLSVYYLNTGDLEAAEDYAQRALTADASSTEAARSLIAVYTNQGDFEKALSTAAELANKGPSGDLMGNYLAGVVLMSSEQYDEAAKKFEYVLSLSSTAKDALQNLVRARLAEGKKELAYSFLNNHIEENGDLTGARTVLSELYLQDGRTEDAVSLLQQTSALFPENVEIYLKLGDAYQRTSMHVEALETYNTGLGIEPNSVALLVRSALANESLKRFEIASNTYEKVLSIEAENVVARNNLAVLLSDRLGAVDRLERAAELMRPYSSSSSPVLLDTLGWVYYKLGETDRAIQYLELAKENGAVGADFMYHLGMAYVQNGQKELAKSELSSALQLNPEFEHSDLISKELEKLI